MLTQREEVNLCSIIILMWKGVNDVPVSLQHPLKKWLGEMIAKLRVCLCVCQDFEMNSELKVGVMTLLEEVLRDADLLPQERKATGNILRYTRAS